MDMTGVPTPKIDWESTNLPGQWKKFHLHVELIFKGPLHEKDEEIKVIKLSRARTLTPNRTPCSKSYSYSRSRGYKSFSYSYSYSSGVQISDFSSKLHSLLRTILKAVSVRNFISNEIYQAEFNKRFQFFICESKDYLFIPFFFLWRIKGVGGGCEM